MKKLHFLFLIASLALLGCETTDDDDNADDDDNDTADDDDDNGSGICDEAKDAECIDEMILDLSLHDDMTSDGDVDTTTDGDDFVTTVDASAHGMNEAANNPWVYIRFDEDGATKLDIDDETALETLDWHIAARRFILRLNGGDNSPSCVAASPFMEMEYADLTEEPSGTNYYEDAYYTADCTIINDSSGLEGSPQVALAPWWSYQDCVRTTMVPFIIRLEDGRLVKLVVEAYYESGQEDCNDGGGMGSGTGSGMYTWRWRFLD